MEMIRLLRADEIECRVATVNEKGVSLLLYKDARVDQKILDETYGPFNWKRSHQTIDGNLYCTVEVYDPEKSEWIPKQDVGVSGYAEKAKSQASDSFKRACFLWGIGRELYSAPFIWVPAERVTITQRKDGYFCNTKFKVSSIEYSDDREITSVVITDSNGQRVYSYQKKSPEIMQAKSKKVTKSQRDMMHQEMKRTGVTFDEIAERYHIQSENEITADQFVCIMQALSKTRSEAA
ncbi:hypothetical protein SAMN02910292_03032 [Lachnospiraceae bacterium XBB2008]|nr:hypothetical protein SAMN02910292_03032 [Lachnospiraceae bacterium XBB2008]